jgi:hypothetical protein
MIKHENVNTKGTYQGYGTRLYFKLILIELKVLAKFTFIYTIWGLSSNKFL